MEITALDMNPVEYFSYLNAAPRSTRPIGGMRGVERVSLPIHLGRISGLPRHLQGLIITSDLQGRVKMPLTGSLTLLGEVLPEALSLLIEIQLEKDPLKFGVILADALAPPRQWQPGVEC